MYSQIGGLNLIENPPMPQASVRNSSSGIKFSSGFGNVGHYLLEYT
ncbi:hypothetical protein [Ulvibacterium sp.]